MAKIPEFQNLWPFHAKNGKAAKLLLKRLTLPISIAVIHVAFGVSPNKEIPVMSRAVRSVPATEFDFGALLAKARAGDRQAIGELVQAFTPYLRATLRRQLRRHPGLRDSDADTLQTAMLRAIERFHECRASARSEFRLWLRRILINYCAKYQRERKRRPVLSLDECPEPMDMRNAEWIEAQQEGEQAAYEAYEAYKELRVDDQLLVLWHYIHDYSWRAISASAHHSEYAVQKAGVRAIRRLADALRGIAPEMFAQEIARKQRHRRQHAPEAKS